VKVADEPVLGKTLLSRKAGKTECQKETFWVERRQEIFLSGRRRAGRDKSADVTPRSSARREGKLGELESGQGKKGGRSKPLGNIQSSCVLLRELRKDGRKGRGNKNEDKFGEKCEGKGEWQRGSLQYVRGRNSR